MRAIHHNLHHPRFGSGVGAVLGIVSGLLFFLSIFGEQLEQSSFDWPFMLFREDGKRNDPVIVRLDDATYAELNQNAYSFDGSLHARLLRRLRQEGTRAVVFDILFVDQNPPPPGDTDLAAAMKEHGKVILAGNLLEQRIDGAIKREPVALRAALEEASAGWGIAKIAAPAGSSVRQHYEGDERVPSLAWKVAEVVGSPRAQDPRERLRTRWLNYYGRDPFTSLAYHRLLDSGYTLPISLSNRVVFVGRMADTGYAGDQKDQFRYPWTTLTGHAPFGVEFHALTYANLASGDWLRRWPWWLEILGLVACGGGLGYLLPKMRPLSSAGIALGAMLLVTTLACLGQLLGNAWFNWLNMVVIQIPLVLMWAILFHSIRSYFEAEFLNRSLALYLSPAQVRQILSTPELLKPGVQQREVSILFSDIANFSKISERMLPEDLAQLLNDYYETTIGCVHETGGTVMNLIGDAILAIWNAPQEQVDHQDRACRAATLLAEKLIVFDKSRQSLRLKTRVGLHTGVVSVGNIGSSAHFDYAVIGENVNLASRLEGLNKYLGTHILATRQIQKPVQEKMPNRLVGHFRFKGLDQVTEIYELILPADASADRTWLSHFGEGLHCFQRGSFRDAERRFREVLQVRPGDGPSEFYLRKIDDLAACPPKPEWMGEIDLDAK